MAKVLALRAGLIVFLCLCSMGSAFGAEPLPNGLVYLEQVDASIVQNIRYAKKNNLIGRPLVGYLAPRCILARQTAEALAEAQAALQKEGLGLKVYDCYRPQMAVDDLAQWAKDLRKQKTKKRYYPRVDKADLLDLGYIKKQSEHSKGIAVDVTLVDRNTKKALKMGTIYGFIGEKAMPLNHAIKGKIHKNRILLRKTMRNFGFEPAEMNWWHFSLRKLQGSKKVFNFPIK